MYQSINNPKIKELNKLKQKKYRDKYNLFLVEGQHLVEEAKKAKVLKERARGILNVHKTLHTKYKATKQYELGIVLGDIYYQYELAQEEYEKAYAQYKYMKDSFPDYTSRMIERRKQLNKKLEEKRAAELQD